MLLPAEIRINVDILCTRQSVTPAITSCHLQYCLWASWTIKLVAAAFPQKISLNKTNNTNLHVHGLCRSTV